MMHYLYPDKMGFLKYKVSPFYVIHRMTSLLYLLRGRAPFSKGYKGYHKEYLFKVLQNDKMLSLFRSNKQLPKGYGLRLDERVVEYPWVYARLSTTPSILLDAGSALNYEYLLTLPLLSKNEIVIYTLSSKGENIVRHDNISYIYGDLRRNILRDATFDEIVCVSTIEHVGLDNTLLYIQDKSYQEASGDDFQAVMWEFYRLLNLNGRLFVTIPYGKYVNFGWMQVFDKSRLEQLVRSFKGVLREIAYYKHGEYGWQIADADSCSECAYYDNHSMGKRKASIAAAGAVACLAFEKT